jgi:hypothetical protein
VLTTSETGKVTVDWFSVLGVEEIATKEILDELSHRINTLKEST